MAYTHTPMHTHTHTHNTHTHAHTLSLSYTHTTHTDAHDRDWGGGGEIGREKERERERERPKWKYGYVRRCGCMTVETSPIGPLAEFLQKGAGSTRSCDKTRSIMCQGFALCLASCVCSFPLSTWCGGQLTTLIHKYVEWKNTSPESRYYIYHTCVRGWVSVCVCMCVCACFCVCSVRVCLLLRVQCVCTFACVVYVCGFVCAMYVRACVCMCACARAWVLACVYVRGGGYTGRSKLWYHRGVRSFQSAACNTM